MSKNYTLEYSKGFLKQFNKMNKFVQRSKLNWHDIHIQNTNNPRQYGKSLSGNLKGRWRYRVGNYRIICSIEEKQLIVLALEVGHRNKIYR